MKIQGKNLGLFAKMEDEMYDTFGLSTNCSINITADVNEMASTSSRAKTYTVGRYSYTLQSDRLYDGGDMMATLLRHMVSGEPILFRMAEGVAVGGEMVQTSGGGMIISGTAIVTGYTVNAPIEGYANVSLSLQGVGDLSIERNGVSLDLGDAASVTTGIIDLEDADSETTGIIDLGKSI
jgi:hypothetical protein